ncbi:hypothetical protein BJ875DRAFT_537145 [Amylocarpus encephaloides]|uniref:C3H1-type domain-containing protein n=1 Tax=Amylocarpus encephaloides TaxID=45428 RepID=A0A9P8C1L2_9HELO|nr:hypothetical protein BJ875DRAFT_537145 [Amylocarpus encephaloides]
MAPCRFWQQGNCKFGDSCRFEHGSNVGSNNNRFAALQTSDRGNDRRNNDFHNRNNAPPNRGQPLADKPFQLDKDQIVTDLSTERPQWILSAYGPGKAAPAQLFGGEMRELSFEEMRVRHYAAVAAGAQQNAIKEAEALWQQSEQQIQTILSNAEGALQYIIDAEKQHPNRIDIVKEGSTVKETNPFSSNKQTIQPRSNPFGGQNDQNNGAIGPPSGGAFGQPPALGQRTSAFGAMSGGTGAFGQPSGLSQNQNAFGAPSTLGQKPNPFAAAPGGNAFGQPSGLGQTQSAFGSPSALKPSPFRTLSTSNNTFGQPSSQARSSTPFGQVLDGNNGFGQPSTVNQNSSGFGAPSGGPFSPQVQPNTSSPFGVPSQTASHYPLSQQNSQVNEISQAFYQPSPARNPFSNTQRPFSASFGAPSQAATANPLLDNQLQAPNSFGAVNQAQGVATITASGFSGSFMVGAQPPIPIDSYSSTGSDGRLTMFKGQKIVYRGEVPGIQNRDGSWAKIWFPKGAPNSSKDSEMDPALYDEKTETAYLHARQTGMFDNGVIPLLPPKVEWCSWEF